MCAIAHFSLDSPCVMAHTACAMKHITLLEARKRAKLTQLQLEELSGVERSRIARLEFEVRANPTVDTAEKLDKALRGLKALRRGEKLVFGQREAVAS
jgi:transcriptional regulator with XRE-family HTH domain